MPKRWSKLHNLIHQIKMDNNWKTRTGDAPKAFKIQAEKEKTPIETVTSTESHAELINGKIVVNERTSSEHNSTVLTIACEFMNKVGDKCKVFTQNIGLYCNEILGDDSNFFLPDIMVVDRDAKVDNEGVHSAPRFVAEVTSEATLKTDYIHKMCIYGEIGALEYWVVDLQRKRIARFLADNDFAPETFDYPNTKTLASKIYPEVKISLSEVFVEEDLVRQEMPAEYYYEAIREVLKKHEIPSNWYSLGSEQEERVNIIYEDGQWLVTTYEKGHRGFEKRCDSIESAGQELFNKLAKSDWQKRRMLSFYQKICTNKQEESETGKAGGIVDELYGIASNVNMSLEEIRDDRLSKQ